MLAQKLSTAFTLEFAASRRNGNIMDNRKEVPIFIKTRLFIEVNNFVGDLSIPKRYRIYMLY
ncbi:hypothetical protein DSCOOX_60550 [Desulfosarcina ovata subsp. ovata]|uniref:Uncharacterized protein n=1 Tax=Desulfosarcina ovata subsp. ovata TaxID=2752305 RepID=A0A5K8AJJ2_9BACT|nr:hypothetical protein DSCOOX_60550 [Desulfosarcina ovata subsp. ovata]